MCVYTHTSTVHVFIIHQLMSLFLTVDLDFFISWLLDFLTSCFPDDHSFVWSPSVATALSFFCFLLGSFLHCGRMVRQHVFLHGFFSVTHIITFGARIFEGTFMPRTHVARHVTFLSTPVVAMGATIRFYVRVPGTNMAVKIGFLRTTVIAILAGMWFIAIVGTHVPCHVRRMICLVLADLAD